MKWTAIAGLVLLFAACAANEPRCKGALRPINPASSPAAENAAAALPP